MFLYSTLAARDCCGFAVPMASDTHRFTLPQNPAPANTNDLHPRRRKSLLLLGFPDESTRTSARKTARFSIERHPRATPALLACLLPDAVAMPLLNGHMDALIHLHHLQEIGFRGRCFVLAPPLPKPKLVLTELRAQARGLRITLLSASAS